MNLHNPLNQSRLCASLGENLEAYETREVPDTFEQCDNCRCTVSAKPAEKKAAGKASG